MISKIFGSQENSISFMGKPQGNLNWALLGEHNRMNALAALAAARHAGVPANTAIAALTQFKNVKRRMEVRGIVRGITVYDDFAHHPTAIRTTIGGLRDKAKGARIIAVLEPRSNTMKMGVWKESLAESLTGADLSFCYNANLGWDAKEALAALGARAVTYDTLEPLVESVAAVVRRGDHVLVMSNGSFGCIHEKLLKAIENVGEAATS